MEMELFEGPCGNYYSSKKVQVLTSRGGAYASSKLYQSEDNKAFDVNLSVPITNNRVDLSHIRINPQYLEGNMEFIVGPGHELYEEIYTAFQQFWEDNEFEMQHVGQPTLYNERIHRMVFDEACKVLCDPKKINDMIMKEVGYQIQEAYKAGMYKEKNRVREILGL